jgi:hypothetical protein
MAGPSGQPLTGARDYGTLLGVEPNESKRPLARIRHVFSGSRHLVRIAYRDPEHVSERLTLYASGRLGEASRAWAQSAMAARPDATPATLAEEVRSQTAQVARIDGAIAGTPFLLALVPGYLTYLWMEMRMTLRTAALFGRDPTELQTAAEMLVLRGVQPDVQTAEAALSTTQETKVPERPEKRRSLRTWVHSVYLMLVFGGFMSPGAAKMPRGPAAKLRAAVSVLIGIAIWVITWVLPVTFMIAMAWGCESHARQLGRRTVAFYGGQAPSRAMSTGDDRQDRGHDRRTIIRGVTLLLSVAIPIGFVAYVDHVRNTTGINWLAGLGLLVAVSLVIATAVVSGRR